MSQMLIHIGYHKTATTWLQLRVFQPEHGFASLLSHEWVDRSIVRPHGFDFDAEQTRTDLEEAQKKVTPPLVPVLSSEILSGHPFYGGFGSDVFAQRLKATQPDARILITIRNQMRMLPSIYMQYLLRGGQQSLDQFFAPNPAPGYPCFDPGHFRYDRLIALYEGLFGKDQVHVLTQESIATDADQAIADLATFAGASAYSGLSDAARQREAPSYPEHAINALRRTNHFRRSTLAPNATLALPTGRRNLLHVVGRLTRTAPFARLSGGGTPVRDYVQDRFGDTFNDSNRKLANMRPDLDLTGWPGV